MVAHASKNDGGSTLARNSCARPFVVGNIFAARVKIRVTPEIRAIDVTRAIPPAIKAFEFVTNSADAPVVPLGQLVVLECIERAHLEGKRRLADFRAARRYVDRAALERVAIMQMLGKIETAFHIMNNSDHVPRHSRLSSDRRVAILGVEDALNHSFDFSHFVSRYFATIKEIVVFLG